MIMLAPSSRAFGRQSTTVYSGRGSRHCYEIKCSDPAIPTSLVTRRELNSTSTEKSHPDWNWGWTSGSYCRLLPPRQIAKLLLGKRMVGRGGGDRKQYRLEFQGLRRNAEER